MHVPCQCKTYIFILRNAHKICPHGSNSNNKQSAVCHFALCKLLVWQWSSTVAAVVVFVSDVCFCEQNWTCERTCKCTRIAVKLETLSASIWMPFFRLVSSFVCSSFRVRRRRRRIGMCSNCWLMSVCVNVEIFTTLVDVCVCVDPFKTCRVPHSTHKHTHTQCTLPSRNGKWITKNSFEIDVCHRKYYYSKLQDHISKEFCVFGIT